MHPTRTDVLIVGAGPTGLALAIALQQAGVDHLLIDRLPEGQNTSRAAVIHAHTLDMLAPLGVVGPLAARGLKLDRFTVRDRDRALLPIRFAGLPTPNDHILMIPQDVTERVLADRLAALGGTIHRGVTATAATQDANGARVTVASAAGDADHRGPLRGGRRRPRQPGAPGRRHRLRRRARRRLVRACRRADGLAARPRRGVAVLLRPGDGGRRAAAGRGVPHRRQPRRRTRASGRRGDPGADRRPRPGRAEPRRGGDLELALPHPPPGRPDLPRRALPPDGRCRARPQPRRRPGDEHRPRRRGRARPAFSPRWSRAAAPRRRSTTTRRCAAPRPSRSSPWPGA